MNIRLLLITAVISLLAGCGEKPRNTFEQNRRLHEQQNDMQARIARLEEENELLRREIRELAEIDSDKRLELLGQVEHVKIGKRSGLYDKDRDGKKEKLIVYIEPFDKNGDLVKMPGVVEVRLFDLAQEAGGQQLGRWRVEPEELGESWASSFMINYYRLTFDISGIQISPDSQLTVSVRFTEYTTGKILTDQQEIHPRNI